MRTVEIILSRIDLGHEVLFRAIFKSVRHFGHFIHILEGMDIKYRLPVGFLIFIVLFEYIHFHTIV
jgi:hypothetical protein